MGETPTNNQLSCRIDKWLWAARFYKTRNLAKQAIEGGKVFYNGQRVKTSKIVELEAKLTVRCGWDDKTVIVTGISDKRRGAPEAALLYRETQESEAARAQKAAERKAAGGPKLHATQRPTKKQRRQIHRFKEQGL